MKKMKIMFMILLAIAGSIGIANAQSPAVMVSDAAGWHKIADKTVSFKTEKEEIAVMGSDRFAAIKFKVTDASIDLISLVITYEKGDAQDVKVDQTIKAPSESRVIDLKGGSERSIKNIAFVYKTVPNSMEEKANVEIWGLKTNTVK